MASRKDEPGDAAVGTMPDGAVTSGAGSVASGAGSVADATAGHSTADRHAGDPGNARSQPASAASRSARWWLSATAACVASIAGISLWIGPSAIIGVWDVFTLLNGSYRIYEGQSPSTDYSNPIGPLVYGLVAMGMHLEHSPSLRAVTYGQVMFLLIAATLAWIISFRRLPTPYASLFTIFVALLSVDVRPLGFSQSQMSYAMLYNRDGWLLYSVLLLLVFLPWRRQGKHVRSPHLSDGAILGVLLGLLFYDKITFFLAALAATALGLLLNTLARGRQFWIAAVAGFLVVAGLVRILFGLHATAYMHDLIVSAQVQGAGQRAWFAEQALKWTSPLILLTILVTGLLYVMRRRETEAARPVLRIVLCSAYVLGSSIALTIGDAPERNELPALVVIPLLIIVFLEPSLPRWAGGPGPRRLAAWPARQYALLLGGLALLLAGTTLPIAGREALGLEHAASYRGYVASPPASQAFDAGPLRDFVIPADSAYQTAYRESGAVPAMINNGLSLLRATVRPGQRVFTLAYTDPFDMALGLPLSRCGPLWWDLGFDFDTQHYPSAQCAIGDATWVIIPRMIPGQGCCQQTVSVMQQLYSGYLTRYYRPFRQTADWILLRRIQSA